MTTGRATRRTRVSSFRINLLLVTPRYDVVKRKYDVRRRESYVHYDLMYTCEYVGFAYCVPIVHLDIAFVTVSSLVLAPARNISRLISLYVHIRNGTFRHLLSLRQASERSIEMSIEGIILYSNGWSPSGLDRIQMFLELRVSIIQIKSWTKSGERNMKGILVR